MSQRGDPPRPGFIGLGVAGLAAQASETVPA